MKGAARVMNRSIWRNGSFGLMTAAAVVCLNQGFAGAQGLRLRDHLEFPALHGGLSPAAGSGGHSTQGYLGVDIRDVSEEQSAASKQKSGREPRGAEIVHIDHDGPAGKAGLREHDVILLMNGQAIEGGDQLRRMLHDAPPGRSLTLTISRDGQQQTISAQMANREDVERQAWEEHVAVVDPLPPAPANDSGSLEHPGSGFFSPGKASRSFLGGIGLSSGYTGVMLEKMAPQLAEFFGAQGKTGLLVRSVDANSPAAVAGLHAGDVVVRVNTTRISSSSDWLKTIRENKGRPVNVIVLRDRREQTLTLTPNAKHHSSLIPDLWPHLGGSHAALLPNGPIEQACLSRGPFQAM